MMNLTVFNIWTKELFKKAKFYSFESAKNVKLRHTKVNSNLQIIRIQVNIVNSFKQQIFRSCTITCSFRFN